MKMELFKHKLAYIVLAGALLVFVFAFMGFWPNRLLQRISIGVVVCFYFFWGTITHIKTDTLTRRVAFEYAAASILAGTLLFFITL